MMKRTHVALGIASSVSIFQPHSLTGIVCAVSAGALGSLIPDIDVSTSESHKDANIVTGSAIALVIGAIVIDKLFHIGMMERITKDSNFVRILVGMFIFIGICAVGKETPHRSLMHSFLGLVITTVSVWISFPILAKYYAVGFISHVGIDLFNKKKLRLLYPSKSGICFKLCSSNGVANHTIGSIATVLAVLEVLILLIR